MTEKSMKEELETKKAEYLQSFKDNGMEFGETVIALLGTVYDQAFIDGSNFILDTVHDALPKGDK